MDRRPHTVGDLSSRCLKDQKIEGSCDGLPFLSGLPRSIGDGDVRFS